MSKYCERVEKRATKTLKLVNNGDYDGCKSSKDASSYTDAIAMMNDRYQAITGQLGTSACGNVVDAFLKGTKVSDEDYNMCKMVGKNISMSLEYARGEYYGKCDDDKKDVSRTDYATITREQHLQKREDKRRQEEAIDRGVSVDQVKKTYSASARGGRQRSF